MKVYFNWQGPIGRETVDEFEKEEGQTFKAFRAYVREMIAEYQMAGMNVYQSRRACRNWRES